MATAAPKPDACWVANEFVKRYYEVRNTFMSQAWLSARYRLANPKGATRCSETSAAALLLMQVLSKHPKYLNRFYKEESQFTLTWRNHGMPDTRETVSTTQVCLLL
jgi:hypothetical protein